MVNTSTPLLSGSGLGLTYPGGVRALDGVDLQLHASELLVVTGPNGSGKSTLLRALAGLQAVDAGSSQLDGRPLAEHSPGDRARRLAWVPQQLTALSDLTVERFVLAGRYARIDRWNGPTRKDLDAVQLALAATDTAELGARTLSALSGGQRQRVLLARALAQEPQVLLVDEPTNALDATHQVAVFKLIAGLAGHGRGVLVVTHDLNLASQFATRMLLLAEGRVVTEGAPEEVLTPEVLCPVYGNDLHFGRSADGRPFVLPWDTSAGSPS
jgi:iron complex transport system ATP-binding protein